MRYRTTLLQNKGISSNSTYFRKTVKHEILPTTNNETPEETKDHSNFSLRKSKSRLIMLAASIGVTFFLMNNNMKHDFTFLTAQAKSKKNRRASLSDGKVVDPNSIEFSLMLSYPDSYADHLSKSIQSASGIATAKNSVEDTANKKYKSIFAMNVGPYIPSLTLPTEHILTSSSCGMWAMDGTPESYFFKTIEIFEKDCFAVQLVNKDTKDIESKSVLNQNSVKKMIHVIMNPFTNVISRYNNHFRHSSTTPTNKNFEVWCAHLDAQFAEKESSIFSESELALMKDIPCHAEFYRFISWHNFAFGITKYLGVPTVALNIESFEEDYDHSLNQLLHFLDIPKENEGGVVFPSIDDSSYYTTNQRKGIMKLVKRLSSDDTWDSVKVYFPEIDSLPTEITASENMVQVSKSEDYVKKYEDTPITLEELKEEKPVDLKYSNLEMKPEIDEWHNDAATEIKSETKTEEKVADIPPKVHSFSMDAETPKFSFDLKPDIPQEVKTEESVQTKEEPVNEELKETVEEIQDMFEAKEKEASNSIVESQNTEETVSQPEERTTEVAESEENDQPIYFKASTEDKPVQPEAAQETTQSEEGNDQPVYFKASSEDKPVQPEAAQVTTQSEENDQSIYFKASTEDKPVQPEAAQETTQSEEGNGQPMYFKASSGEKSNSQEETQPKITWDHDFGVDVANFANSYKKIISTDTTSTGTENKQEGFEKYVNNLQQKEGQKALVLDSRRQIIDGDAVVEKSVDPAFDITGLRAPLLSADGPKVAWLLTFPSSGTTYTSKLVRQSSKTTTGTNYGNEYVNSEGVSVPLYSDIKGPYIVDETLSVPNTYILTKTHCGSRCTDCGPKEYIETADEYLEKCLRAPRVVKDTDNTVEIQIAQGVTQSMEFGSYNPSSVRKIVHVIKDPYDNIVSRFHHEYKSLVQKFASKDKFPYSYDKEGFQEFCQDEDDRYIEEEATTYTAEILELSKDVPCHADFYKYVQWHNHAFSAAEKLNITTHAINYEDYSNKLDETVDGMLNYLELAKATDEKLAPFKWENAHDHFTEEQMTGVKLFIKELASDKTWSYLKSYFEEGSEEEVVPKADYEEVVEQSVQEDTQTENVVPKEIQETNEASVQEKAQAVEIAVDSTVNEPAGFKRLTAPVTSTEGPKVAWLLTFPSSGTTYTSKLIRESSKTTTGTNYGNEYVNSFGESVSLYSDINGPYIVNETLSVPSTYILTKTHCGSRCMDCSPQEYVETRDSFLKQCLRAPRVKNNVETKEVQIALGVTQSLDFVSYDPSVVRKIVHVVKDPLDNIVSRFHHEYKSLVQKFDSKEEFPYSYDKEGFQEFCEFMDKKHRIAKEQYYGETLSLIAKHVPCHEDFYKYVQWHNLAFEVAEELDIESHVINYEDYGDKLEDTVDNMLNYLELPRVDEKLVPFKWDNAHDHFNKQQMNAIGLFVQKLASDKTWEYMKDYFKDIKLPKKTDTKEVAVVDEKKAEEPQTPVSESNEEKVVETKDEQVNTEVATDSDKKDDELISNSDLKRLTAPVTSTDGPKVAWLMTFPGAGTTYTSKLIRESSQTTTATNYGNEYVNSMGESVSLYSDVNGPSIVNETLSVPSTYILTKTHCGSRCVDCSPKEYIETADDYLAKCLRAPRVRNNVDTKEVQVANGVAQSMEFLTYEPSLVRKIVHVVKDPFDNIVSRFHHEYKSLVQKFDSKDKFPYTYNKEGFQQYCEDQDKLYAEEEKEMYSQSVHFISKHVPCHADFYKYVQWHNLAFEVAEKLDIESHVMNYEDYRDKLDDTVTGMLKYLELPRASQEKLAPFKWEAAHDHFDGKQMNAIAVFIEELASERTWEYLKGYFNKTDDVDNSTENRKVENSSRR